MDKRPSAGYIAVLQCGHSAYSRGEPTIGDQIVCSGLSEPRAVVRVDVIPERAAPGIPECGAQGLTQLCNAAAGPHDRHVYFIPESDEPLFVWAVSRETRQASA